MKPKLEIASIWEDDDLFEVRITASNLYFSGTAECYTTREEIQSLATSLKDFPLENSQVVSFSTGENINNSFFNLQFKTTNASGHTAVRVKIMHIYSSNLPKEISSSEFDLPVEPAAIDRFASSLNLLAIKPVGEIVAFIKCT